MPVAPGLSFLKVFVLGLLSLFMVGCSSDNDVSEFCEDAIIALNGEFNTNLYALESNDTRVFAAGVNAIFEAPINDSANFTELVSTGADDLALDDEFLYASVGTDLLKIDLVSGNTETLTLREIGTDELLADFTESSRLVSIAVYEGFIYGIERFILPGEGLGGRILKVNPADGRFEVLTGDKNVDEVGFVNGPASAVRFSTPTSIAASDGTLFISEGDTIRRVDIATGEAALLAGRRDSWGQDDGSFTSATFAGVLDIVVDGDRLYVLDLDNSNVKVRVLDLVGRFVSTLAGGESDPSDDSDALFKTQVTEAGVRAARGEIQMFTNSLTVLRNAQDAEGVQIVTALGLQIFGQKAGVSSRGDEPQYRIDVPPGCLEQSTNAQFAVTANVSGLTKRAMLAVDYLNDVEALAFSRTIVRNGPVSLGSYSEGTPFRVRVSSGGSPGQVCTVTNGGRRSVQAPIDDIRISCEPDPAAPGDNTPPQTPTIDAVTDDQTPTAVIQGTFDPNDSASLVVVVNDERYVLSRDAELVQSEVDATEWQVTVPRVQDPLGQSYQVTATAIDSADNVASGSALLTLFNPAENPVVKEATYWPESNDGQADNAVLWGIFDPENTADFSVSVLGTTYVLGVDDELTADGNEWQLLLDLNGVTAGAYEVEARAVGNDTVERFDSTNNELTVSDGARPAGVWAVNSIQTNTTAEPPSGVFPPDTRFSVMVGQGSLEYFAEVNASQANSIVLEGDSLSSGQWEWDWQQALGSQQDLADGTYTVVLVEGDLSGYWQSRVRARGVWTLDTVPPSAPLVTPLSTNDQDASPTLTGSFDSTDSARFTVTVSGTTYTMAESPELTLPMTDTWQLALDTAFTGGLYDVIAISEDAAGNTTSDTTSNELSVLSAAPSNVMVTPGDGELSLSWDAVAGASGYTVYYSTSSDVSTADASASFATNSGTIGSLTNGTTYYVIVTTENAAGQSNASSAVDDTPVDLTAPTVTLSPDGRDFSTSISVSLACNDPGPGASGCSNIYFTTDGSTPTTASSVYSAAIELTDSATIQALAVDNAGNESIVASEEYTLLPPAAPTNLSALASASGQITLNWTGAVDADSYNVYYGESSGVTPANGSPVNDISSGDAVTGLTNGTTYYFIVVAVNAAGEGDASNEVSAQPVETDDTAPTVTDRTPAVDATEVSTDTAVTATFSEDMLSASIDDSSFTLDDGSPVSSSVSFDAISNIATLTPDRNLALASTHTATLTADITDLSGNPLSETSWSFTTADGAWATDLEVSEASGAIDTNSAQIAVDPDGNAVAVWLEFDGSTTDVVASRYTNADGWGAPVVIETGSEQAATPDIAMDGNGNAFAVWQRSDGADGANDAWVARYDAAGDAWSSPEQLDSAANSIDVNSPKVAADASGNAIAVWEQGGTAISVYGSRYDSGAWSTPTLLETDDSSDALGAVIAINRSGVAAVAWSRGDGVLSGAVEAVRYDGGWSTPELVESDGSTLDLFPSVGIDSAGNTLVAWTQVNAAVDVAANRYDAGTGSWGTAEIISDEVNNTGSVQLAVGENGDAMAVWSETDSGTGDLNMVANRFEGDSTSWDAVPQTLEAASDPIFLPSVVMDRAGNALSVWVQASSGVDSVWSARNIGGSWSQAEVIESDDTNFVQSGTIGLGVNAGGVGSAVWHQDDGSGTFDVRSNRFE